MDINYKATQRNLFQYFTPFSVNNTEAFILYLSNIKLKRLGWKCTWNTWHTIGRNLEQMALITLDLLEPFNNNLDVNWNTLIILIIVGRGTNL